MSNPCIAVAIIIFIFKVTLNVEASDVIKNQEREIPLTLQSAIETTLLERAEIKLEDVQLLGVQAELEEAKSAFLPTLDLLIQQEKIKLFDEFAGVEISGTVGEQQFTASLIRDLPTYQFFSEFRGMLNVYAGGSDVARIKKIMAKKKQAEARRLVIKNQLVVEIATRYWELRRDQVIKTDLLRAVDLARKEAEWTSSQYREGRLSEIDADIQLLHTAEKEAEAANAENRVELSLKRYLLALGKFDKVVEISQIKNLIDDPDEFSIENLFQSDNEERHPELEQNKAEIEIAYAHEKMVLADLYPRIDFYSSYTFVGRDSDSVTNGWSNFRREEWIIAIRLGWNIFNGFQTRYRIAQARSNITTAILRLEMRKKKLDDEFQEKVSRVHSLEKELDLAEKRLRLAQAQERIAKVRYETLQHSRLEYEAARLNIESANTKVIVTKINLVLAQLALALK